MAAGGAVVGVIMPGQRRFPFNRLGTLSMFVIVPVPRAPAMMVMASMLRRLVASQVFTVGPMRMGPGRQQTIPQVQKNCTEGDDFEVPA